MSANYKKLGDIVELIDERNKDGKVQNLIGVSIDKCFIKSVANTIGTDLTKYQVIRKNDFACSLMQVSRDGKIPIACLKDYDEAIMSPAYYIFRIRNTNEVLPDYLAMWFMRTEFDREASYIAVGGVRGSMPWEDFCDMKLPIPDLKEQEKIVNTYNAITKRIQLKQKINENLEKTAQTIYKRMFVEDADLTLGKLKNFCSVFTGFPFDSELYSDSDGIKTLRGENVTEEKLRWDTLKRYNGEITERIEKNYLHEWDIVIGMDGSKVGKNWSLVHNFDLPLLLAQRVACIRTNSISTQLFLYISLKIGKFTEYVTQVNTGTTILHISGSQIEDFPVLIPNDALLEDFGNKVIPLYEQRRNNIDEINKLQFFKQIVISLISGM